MVTYKNLWMTNMTEDESTHVELLTKYFNERTAKPDEEQDIIVEKQKFGVGPTFT